MKILKSVLSLGLVAVSSTLALQSLFAQPTGSITNLITDPANALQPALQEWTDGNLNAAADRNDILTVTKVINGGTNGLAERQQWFAQVWPIASGGQSAPAPAAGQGSGDEATRWLQDALNRLGAQPQLAVDGQAGAATTQAVQWFQASAGLAVDGIAGEATRAAIQQRLASA